MPIDPVKSNFAKIQVATTYGASDTTITLVSGGTALLSNPATEGNFPLVWWDSTNYPDPADDPKAEIIRVTAISGDELTVTRGSDGTTASTKNTSGATYKVQRAPTRRLALQLRALLNKVYSVTDPKWGAAGDGTTDDTQAIQNCLNSAAADGASIYFPPGTYLVNGVSPSAVPHVIYGDYGLSILKQSAANTNILTIQDASQLYIAGLKFQGVSGTVTASGNLGIAITSSAGSPAIGDNKDIIIRDCWFRQLRFHGLRVQYANGVSISGNFIDTCSDGIGVESCSNVKLHGNQLNASQVPDTSSSLVSGISINTVSSSPSEHNSNVVVSGNQVDSRTNSQSILVHDAHGVVISDNVLTDAMNGIYAAPASSGSQQVKDITIKGNTIRCVTTASPSASVANDGITVGGQNTGNRLEGAVVSGNAVYNANVATNSTGQGGIRVSDWTDGIVISGNVVRGAKGYGIVLAGTVTDATVGTNTIRNVISGASGQIGLGVRPSAVIDGIFEGNSISDAADGIRTDGDASGVECWGNRFSNCTNLVTIASGGSLDQSPWFRHFAMTDGVTAPGTSSGYAKLYVDTADGGFRIRFGDGTIGKLVENDGSLNVNGDIDATGGYRNVIDGWYADNPSANLTAWTLLRLYGPDNSPEAFFALRDGSITALGAFSSLACTAGSATFEIYKNGTATGVTAVIDSTHQTMVTSQAKDTTTISSGDQLDVRLTTTSDWAPTTTDVRVLIEIET